MGKFKRIFVIVVDSFGAGNGRDAKAYGDEGTDTMGHIAESVDHWEIPTCRNWEWLICIPLRELRPWKSPWDTTR